MVWVGADANGEEILLRYGVLGLLIERRGYGYDLVQRLSNRLGAAWQLNPSTVYTALDQLEEAKLIEPARDVGNDQPVDRLSRRSGRVVYEATDNGVSEFQAWLARPSARVSPIRSEIQLKVALVGPDNVPPLLASIAQEEWTIMRRLHEECQVVGQDRGAQPELGGSSGRQVLADEPGVSGRREALDKQGEPGQLGASVHRAAMGERDARGTAGEWPSTATALVNAAATTRLQAELAWIEVVRETLQRMSAEQVTAAGGVTGLVDAATLR